jgi:hypothetical protein
MGKNAKRRKTERLRAKQLRKKRGITKVRDSDGKRTIHFEKGSEFEQALNDQLQAFEEKFGRPPAPDDPLFFDPDADTPQPISPVKVETVMVEAMQKIGLDPAFIYAHQQTGMLPNPANIDLFSKEDLQEWNEAVERYRKLHPEEDEGG